MLVVLLVQCLVLLGLVLIVLVLVLVLVVLVVLVVTLVTAVAYVPLTLMLVPVIDLEAVLTALAEELLVFGARVYQKRPSEISVLENGKLARKILGFGEDD